MLSLDSSVDRAADFESASVVGSNPTQATKKCNSCKRNLKLDLFGYKNKNNGVTQSNCKICQRKISSEHYRNNKNSYLERNQRRKKEVVSYVENWKSSPCEDCGIIYPPRVMDLHHQGEKEDIISRMMNQTTLPKIKRELDKCILLCANCHRLRTFY